MTDKQRAEWTTAYINNLPDSSFLYIAPGGSKDADGKTTPRSLRYFPYKDANGTVDLPHLRNALARIPQSNLPASVKATATAKAQRILQNQGGRSVSDDEEREEMNAVELVYRASEPEAMRFREEEDSLPVLEGRMMPYDEWADVNSSREGHFLERFAQGSLLKTLTERRTRIRALFEHGLDFLGRQPIATFDDFRDEEDGAHFEATLLRGLPDLLIEGLRKGVYGSSIRFKPVPGKWERIQSPGRSEHNPDGLPEHTIREAYVQEFSVVTFPQYEGATAHVRSITDEVAARQLMANPARLIEILDSFTNTTEPQHSVREDQAAPDPERSRSTQKPSRDYLTPGREDASWRL